MSSSTSTSTSPTIINIETLRRIQSHQTKRRPEFDRIKYLLISFIFIVSSLIYAVLFRKNEITKLSPSRSCSPITFQLAYGWTSIATTTTILMAGRRQTTGRRQQKQKAVVINLLSSSTSLLPFHSPLRSRNLICSMIGRGISDLDIVFGSDAMANVSGGVSWGEAEEDDDEDDSNNPDRQRTRLMQQLFSEQDEETKNERKKQLWGSYANATNRTEFQQIYEQQQLTIQNEFSRQQQLAKEQGVFFEILEPSDDEEQYEYESVGNTVVDENGLVQITAGASSLTSSSRRTGIPRWYSEMDDELRSEWEQLTSKDDSEGQFNTDEDDADDDDNAVTAKMAVRSTDEENTELPSTTNPLDVRISTNSGKLMARHAFSGVRVGSAGGWSLEVFPGDYVVHRKYGIGRFERTCLKSKTRLSKDERIAQEQRRAEILSSELRRLQQEGQNLDDANSKTKKKSITADDIQQIRSKFGTSDDLDPISNPQTTVFEITYKDAVVHVPVDRAYRLSRYRAGDAFIKPKLSRVKGEAWIKTRRSVEDSTLALAQDVLALYAKREMLQRQPFHPDAESMVKSFESTFPYVPTPDQIRCFDDIENDMVWRSRPMDRLICGDVGFGKTEVALRALYRAVVNGKQCALLSPTGVLAAQHYKNILKRMGPSTPFNVTCTLLRGGMGKKTKTGREIRDQISTGQIQLIVGTHALLGNDLEFHDLGLLVVDEEQRFGVKQKERLKLISNGVDVLTLSATPIPRTLQMSLSGVRDTSTIRSPPPMRKPVITYVQDFTEELVYSAISTELSRGGQCYYVVPRISMLAEAETILHKLFPTIRIIQAHGRMQRNGAEENVAAFAEGNADVLLATTVIENGVDIPSVNTIIVQNSQAFGMSTLYQLRGRVGRSDQQAYAYFLHREESVTEQAALRLQAIGDLQELGSGFDVANRDLEIRGAGSLLGTEQSGLASKVGFDLYMRLLKKSIRKLRGLDIQTVPRTNIITTLDALEPTSNIDRYQPNAFIVPSTYISNSTLRTSEESKARLAESTAKLVELTNEWKNQYGPIPPSIQNQLKTMHLHACTRRLGIDLVGLIDSGVEVETEDSVDPATMPTRRDLIMRSPGLRPRHWAMIVSELPKRAMPRGFDVVFPSRFTRFGEELEIEGGRRVDIESLIADVSLDSIDEDNEDDWDALDQEDVEAMKVISSASNVRTMDDSEIEQYPRFVMKGGGGTIDRVLRFLLPIAKIVYERQEGQATNAKAAAALRERQESMRRRKKASDVVDARRSGYNY